MNYKSTVSQPASITDLSFEDYNKRQLYEISAERNSERALNAKPAGNFIHDGNNWLPQEYEGFAVVSMLSENEENGYLAKRLIELQKELQYNLTPKNGFAFFKYLRRGLLPTHRLTHERGATVKQFAVSTPLAAAVWLPPAVRRSRLCRRTSA